MLVSGTRISLAKGERGDELQDIGLEDMIRCGSEDRGSVRRPTATMSMAYPSM